MRRENYVPEPARILEVKKESDTVRTYSLRLKSGKPLVFRPGQFVQASVLGVGECPISMCSCPLEESHFEVSIRNMGRVTDAISGLRKGGTLWVRGPYGNGFPVEKFAGRHIVLVAGGVGFPPLNSVVEYLSKKFDDHGDITLLYGVRDPSNLIFDDKIAMWKKRGVNVMTTVDRPDGKWKGNVGVVTTLFDKYDIRGEIGITCGPPVMMKYVTESFRKIGIKNSDMYISMERMMQCGTGKCGHCNIGNKYVCKDGPVFTYEELEKLTEEIWE